MTTNRREKIVFGVLIFLSVVLVGLAFFCRLLSGMALYDTHQHIFDDVLTEEQGDGIIDYFKSVIGVYIWLLVISNIIWVVGVRYLMSRFTRDKSKSPNTALEPTPTAP